MAAEPTVKRLFSGSVSSARRVVGYLGAVMGADAYDATAPTSRLTTPTSSPRPSASSGGSTWTGWSATPRWRC